MRAHTTLLVLLVLACCAPQQTPPKPPDQKEHAAGLSSYDPTMDALKENPLPTSNMPGCYAVILPKGGGSEDMPSFLELTAEPREAPYPRRAFGVRSPVSQAHSDRSSWLVKRDGSIQVTHGNGYWGWEFTLRQTSQGFAGSARSYTDDSSASRTVEVEFRKKPCS